MKGRHKPWLGPLQRIGGSREESRWLLIFSALNALGSALIAFANVPHDQLLGGPSARPAFLIAAALGHFGFFALLLALPGFLLYCICGSRKLLTVSVVVLNTAWVLVLLADAKVFALYRFHLNGMVLNMLLGGALSEQVQVSGQMWAMSVGVAVLALAGEIALALAAWRWLQFRGERRIARYVCAAMLSLMIVSQAMAAYHDARADHSKMRLLAYVPWAQPLTMKGTLHKLGVAVADSVEPPNNDGGTLHYPLKPLQCNADRPDLNVLIVLVESLRADVFAPSTMPRTWSWAQAATRYTRHYSTGNATRFGLFGLMYGLPGGYWQTMLTEQRGPVLIDQLQQAGYAMRIYGSAPLYSPEFDRTAFSQVRNRVVNAPKGPGATRDRYVIDRMRNDIRAQPKDQPFFGFVFLDSTHAPYHLPEASSPPSILMPTASISSSSGPGRIRRRSAIATKAPCCMPIS